MPVKKQTKKLVKITAKVIKPKKKEKEYDEGELENGIEVEKEHTPDKRLQKNIAKNHLDEDGNYYNKLSKIEKKKNEKK